MIMLTLGFLMIGVAAVLDSIFLLRMTRLGHRWALLQGGAFDYSKYHQVRKENGWAAWPVFLMWAAMIAGIGLLIGGFFTYFGTTPH
jgi:hypothetical protein